MNSVIEKLKKAAASNNGLTVNTMDKEKNNKTKKDERVASNWDYASMRDTR